MPLMTPTGTRQPLKRVDLKQEQRMAAVKRLLKDHHFPEQFSVESLDLVEHMMNDHIRLLDNLKQSQQEMENAAKNVAKMQKEFDPLKRDLASALRENKDLNKEVIRLGEELSKKDHANHSTVKKQEGKIMEQGFVIAQQSQKILELEKQVEERQDRIEQLMDRNFTHIVTEQGDFKVRGQEMERKRPLSSSSVASVSGSSSSSLHHPSLPVAASNIDALALTEKQLQEMTSAYETAKKEIDHLQSILLAESKKSVGMEASAASLSAKDGEKADQANIRIIERQRDQLDNITAQLIAAEKKIKSMEMSTEDLKSTRSRLEEAEAAVTNAQSERSRLQKELAESQQLLKNTQREATTWESEMKSLVKEKEFIEADARAAKERLKEVEEAIDVEGLVDAGSLTDDQIRVRVMTLEKDRQLMMMKMREMQHSLDDQKHEHQQIHHAYLIARADRDNLHSQVETLQQQLLIQKESRAAAEETSEELQVNVRRLEVSLNHAKEDLSQLEHQHLEIIEKNRRLETRLQTVDITGAESASLERRISHLQMKLQESYNDNEMCKKEMGDIAAKYRDLLHTLEEQENSMTATNDKLNKVEKERDDLAVFLNSIEQQLMSIQTTITSVTDERDQAVIGWKDARKSLQIKEAEVETMRDEIETLIQRLGSAEEQMHKAIQDKDDTNIKYQAATAELDTLSKVKSTTSTEQSKKMQEMLNAMDKFKDNLGNVVEERDALAVQLKQVRMQLQAAEHKVEAAWKEVGLAQQEVEEKQDGIEKLQQLIGQMDTTQAEMRALIRDYMSQTQSNKEELEAYESRIVEMQHVIDTLEEEKNRIWRTTETLERKCDALNAQLDTKDEEIAMLQNSIKSKEKPVQKLEKELMTATQQLQLFADTLTQRDSEIAMLRNKLETEITKKRQLDAEFKVLQDQVQGMKADMTVMAKENQTITSELSLVMNHKNECETELDAAMRKIQLAEQLVKAKEREKDDILTNYKALNDEKQRIRLTNERLQQEIEEAHSHITALEQRLVMVETSLQQSLENEQNMTNDISALEAENRHLGDQNHQLKRQLENNEEECGALKQEAMMISNMHASVDYNNQEKQRQIAVLHDDLERAKEALKNVQKEHTALNQKVLLEKQKYRELEAVLQTVREKEHSLFLSEQNKVMELRDLSQHLKVAKSDLEKNQAELRAALAEKEEINYELQKMRRLAANSSSSKDALLQEITQLRNKCQELSLVNKHHEGRIEAMEVDRATLQSRIEGLTADNTNTDRQYMNIHQKLQQRDAAVRDLEDSLKSLQLEKSKLEEICQKLQSKLARFGGRDNFEDLQSTMNLQTENAQLRLELEKCQHVISEHKEKIRELRREYDSLSEMTRNLQKENSDLLGKLHDALSTTVSTLI